MGTFELPYDIVMTKKTISINPLTHSYNCLFFFKKEGKIKWYFFYFCVQAKLRRTDFLN